VSRPTRRELIAALNQPAPETVDEAWTAALALVDEPTKAKLSLEISERLLAQLPDPRLKVQVQVARMHLEGKATRAQFDRAESMGDEVCMELENGTRVWAGGSLGRRRLAQK